MTMRLEWHPFRLRLRSPFEAAHGVLEERSGVLVLLRDDAGAFGIGEASPLPSFAGGTVAETVAALASIGQQVRGLSLEEIWRAEIDCCDVVPGSAAAARCGFETTVADLLARREHLPLAAWFSRQSGAGDPAPAPIPVNAVIGGIGPDEAARQARAFVALGYGTLKVKVGMEAEGDEHRLAAVRAAIPREVTVRVDANGAWPDAETALARLERLAAFDVSLCEQPVPPSAGLEPMAEVTRRSSVPVAIDEACRSLDDLRAAVESRAAQAFVVKPMVTGLREALRMLSFGRGEGLTGIVTTTFDSGVGTALATHLAALLPEPRPACGLSTLDAIEDDFTHGLPPVERGAIRLPDGPGLGVEVDQVKLRKVATEVTGGVEL